MERSKAAVVTMSRGQAAARLVHAATWLVVASLVLVSRTSAQSHGARGAASSPPRENAALAALVEASGFEGVVALHDVASGARWVSDPALAQAALLPATQSALDAASCLPPLEQVDLLQQLQAGTLPAGATIAEFIVVERDADHVLRSKSGLRQRPAGKVGRSIDGQVAWQVGWVERGERTLLFATWLFAKESALALGPACEAVTRGALQLFDALPDPHAAEGVALLQELFPATYTNTRAHSVPLSPWTNHRVFTYSHFTWPHIPSARGAFDGAGVPRLFSASPGVKLGDPIESFNALAREEALTLADDAGADRYARFALDCWLVGFTGSRWFPSVGAAVAANRARLAGEPWRRAAGPLGLVATEEGWRLDGAWIEEGFTVCHVVELQLRRDGTIELSTRLVDLPR